MKVLFVWLLALLIGGTAHAKVLQVGPEHDLKTPSEAAAIAQTWDTVEIEAGDYYGDVAVWTQNHLTIRGVNGRPHLHAAGRLAERKAIWVIKGHNVVVDNIEMSGASAPGFAGSAIRIESGRLTLRNMRIHGNQMGVLTYNTLRGDLTIVDSEIYDNTVDYERYGHWGHNIYVGRIGRFELRDSHVHGAVVGHNVKTRSRDNTIANNIIEDGPTGAASRLIDISEGGDAVVYGNWMQKGPDAANRDIIGYMLEGDRTRPGTAFVFNNEVTQSGSRSTLVHNGGSSTRAILLDNVLTGSFRLLRGPGVVLSSEDPPPAPEPDPVPEPEPDPVPEPGPEPGPEPVCNTFVLEDFESSSGGWSPAGSCTTGDFVRGSPTLMVDTSGGKLTTQPDGPSAGAYALVTAPDNVSLGTDDVDLGECVTTSPTYQMDADGTLSLDWFFAQRDVGDDVDDGFRLELSRDDGATWETLVSYGDVRVEAVWKTHSVPVAQGENLVIRVTASDGPVPTPGGDIVEAGIDEVVLEICQ
jgi:hypothetical protein